LYYLIPSRDFENEFTVPRWFMQAFNHVFLSEHQWAYLPCKKYGNGKSEPFPGEYNYNNIVSLDLFACYKRYPAEVKDIAADFNETWCNHSTSAFLHYFGRRDLALYFSNKSANTCVEYMRENLTIIGKPHHSYCGSFIIAAYYNEGGHGHVAPVIGVGMKDKQVYVANVGMVQRHGVVDVHTAFGVDEGKIEYFLVEV